MHVTFYQRFDRLLGSWIINEFLKNSFKDIPGKAGVSRINDNYAFVNANN